MKKNQKASLPFGIKFKGYDIASVDDYMASEREKVNEIQLKQKEEFSALKAQFSKVCAECQLLKNREEQIKHTLLSATEKAERMNEDISLKYALELDRLRLFRAKWLSAYDEMKERYHFSKDALNMESVVLNTEMELQKFLANNFSMSKGDGMDIKEKHFKCEAERISKSMQSSIDIVKESIQNAVSKKYSDKSIRQNSSNMKELDEAVPAFSIEEALNPTESLQELCEYFGLKG